MLGRRRLHSCLAMHPGLILEADMSPDLIFGILERPIEYDSHALLRHSIYPSNKKSFEENSIAGIFKNHFAFFFLTAAFELLQPFCISNAL